ncbi:tyrosine kinase family catalytic domain protein [Rhizoctonia solani AG-3 Rhs1AP]|uniref:Tyrosine kinase family catalytic domain protein n=2 Tax=Rhizoctonia solani AG-3 TaxID=1086053 RepID=A0A074RYZ6_9AGAM|nr:tyrosine kinase family catalytic domain protein [Rhizoctonia solani AG-3 Rhs1AP]KEP52209.1 tyrosine kinase family catalytic domain protein [Rhizoctonia solani 123E]
MRVSGASRTQCGSIDTSFGPSMELGDAICELAKYQCLDLTEKVAFLGNEDDIDVIGGFYDIFKASLIGYEGVVAVKCSGNAVLEHIVNELRVVSKLEHSNVLPCLGYIVTDLRRSSSYDRLPNQHIIGIVYPWIDLNLRDYLKLRPSANRAYLCNQVIEGLQYLHDTEVIHGDLRGRTIMISGQGTVQITGFGGSVLREDPPGHGNNFQMAGRWAAPERMLAVGAEPTIKADIWSLGMVILESFTGDMPYPELSELHALVAVADGRIPARPDKLINVKAGYSEILWELLLLCFQFVPGDRPALKSVRDIMTVIQREGQVNTEENDTNHTTIKRTTTLPTIIDRLVDQGCLDVTKQLRYMDESPKYSGALSDVYQARLFNGKLVAVKCLRALTNSESKPEKVFKRTAREIYAWSIATHPNILELEGLAVFRDKLAMVAPWMPYSSLLAYIAETPQSDRCNLCTQVAEGLLYIHGLGIAHGDIKGDNVVVSNEGMAKITDFGCATMRRDFPVAFTATESLSYSVRWAAPELFLDEGIKTNYETDVYALGMTILEVLTGNVPHKDKADLAVIHTVVFRKEHPARPVDCIPPHSAKGDELWSMLGRCWSYEPRLRPKASEVRDFLNSMTQSELAI